MFIPIGSKRRRPRHENFSEVASIMAEFLGKAEENDAKRWRMEAEMEQKRQEEERKHEEKLMRMMMGVIQQIAGARPQRTQLPSRPPLYQFPNDANQIVNPGHSFPSPGPSRSFPNYSAPQHMMFDSNAYDSESEL